jgi:serine/threonine-protein kinase RsbW
MTGSPTTNKRPSRNQVAALTIESRTEKLSLVREVIAGTARAVGFDEEAANKIALAVDEACTNIIKHSYKFATDKEIKIFVYTNGGTFEIIIQDFGVAFDPEAIKSPNMREYLSQYRRGGLGVYLMKSLMDRVEYNVVPGEKNEVRLTKSLPRK